MSTECPKRRQFLTEPGEQLLLCQSAVQMAVRYTEWLEFTGVAAVPDAVVSVVGPAPARRRCGIR